MKDASGKGRTRIRAGDLEVGQWNVVPIQISTLTINTPHRSNLHDCYTLLNCFSDFKSFQYLPSPPIPQHPHNVTNPPSPTTALRSHHDTDPNDRRLRPRFRIPLTPALSPLNYPALPRLRPLPPPRLAPPQPINTKRSIARPVPAHRRRSHGGDMVWVWVRFVVSLSFIRRGLGLGPRSHVICADNGVSCATQA